MRSILTTLAVLCFTQWAFAFTQQQACADYSIGEGHSFTVYRPPMPISHYTVVRDSETAYSVYINVDFLGDQRIKDRTQACLKEVNVFGLGSDQQNIFLRLYEDGITQAPAPRKTMIQVHEKFSRADSKNFSVDLECTSIVHELLHSAGLSDEYQELSLHRVKGLPITRETAGGKNADTPAYDCRARSNSIMADSYSYNFSKHRYNYHIEMACACPKSVGSETCNQEMEKYWARAEQAPQTECPAGMERGVLTGWSLSAPLEKPDSDYSFIAGLPFFKARVNPLRPAHIRTILYPHCKTNNQVYDQCTANAYRTSKKNGGSGCYPAPEICNTDNAWLD